MESTVFQRFERAIHLLRTLSEVLGVRPCLDGSETLRNDRLLQLMLGLVDEGRMRPALIPIRSRRCG